MEERIGVLLRLQPICESVLKLESEER
jgi:hypothetical protein